MFEETGIHSLLVGETLLAPNYESVMGFLNVYEVNTAELKIGHPLTRYLENFVPLRKRSWFLESLKNY